MALSKPEYTGSRMGLTPLETPASVEVLSGETIRARGDQSVREAVTRAHRHHRQPLAGQRQYLADRARLCGAGLGHAIAGRHAHVRGFRHGDLPVRHVVGGPHRGAARPASVMYGEGAIGGVVNVVQKKPIRGPIENELQITGGTEKTARVAFDGGGKVNDNLSYRFATAYNRAAGWVDRGDANNLMVSASVRLDVNPEFNLTLSWDDGTQHPQQHLGTPLGQWQFGPLAAQEELQHWRCRDQLSRPLDAPECRMDAERPRHRT